MVSDEVSVYTYALATGILSPISTEKASPSGSEGECSVVFGRFLVFFTSGGTDLCLTGELKFYDSDIKSELWLYDTELCQWTLVGQNYTKRIHPRDQKMNQKELALDANISEQKLINWKSKAPKVAADILKIQEITGAPLDVIIKEVPA